MPRTIRKSPRPAADILTSHIALVKVRAELPRQALEALGLKFDGSLKSNVARLDQHHSHSDAECRNCHECNGAYPLADRACCYCGAKPKPKPKSKGLAKVTPKAMAKAAAKYAERVATIERCYVNATLEFHRIGVEITAIRHGELWKAIPHPNGAAGVSKYESFSLWMKSGEIPLDTRSMFRAMQIAGEFTKDEIEGLSLGQVRVVLSVAKEDRGEVLTAAQSGERGTALSERAASLQARDSKVAPPTMPAHLTQVAPAPTEAVTVATALKKQTVDLYKHGTTGDYDLDGALPALNLGEKPWFVVEMSNNMELRVQIIGRTGRNRALQAVVEFIRTPDTLT